MYDLSRLPVRSILFQIMLLRPDDVWMYYLVTMLSRSFARMTVFVQRTNCSLNPNATIFGVMPERLSKNVFTNVASSVGLHLYL